MTMGLEAVGAYLRIYRDARQLTQEEVGAAVGVSGKQVYNWERGIHDPKSTFMAALLKLLRVPPEDVVRLLNSPDATAADGEGLAHASLAAEHMPRRYLTESERRAILRARPEDLSQEEKDEIINQLWRLYGETDQ
jgi:transcriptional regulator with XRE-family HTH domain